MLIILESQVFSLKKIRENYWCFFLNNIGQKSMAKCWRSQWSSVEPLWFDRSQVIFISYFIFQFFISLVSNATKYLLSSFIFQFFISLFSNATKYLLWQILHSIVWGIKESWHLLTGFVHIYFRNFSLNFFRCFFW